MRTSTLVDDWFGPTTYNFVVLERSVLSCMPELWQQRFVKVMQELDDATQTTEQPLAYEIRVKDLDGNKAASPVRESIVVDINPAIQRERAAEFLREMMVQYGISVSELDITGA